MTVHILTGDCRELLRALPSESVHCVVTSPPCYGLRDYDVDGQIGHELTLKLYIAELVAVFAEVRRVLRRDGVAWLNIGDAYAGSQSNTAERKTKAQISRNDVINRPRRARSMAEVSSLDIKDGDMMLIPARISIALQQDGWWVRKRVIWHKPNPMTESVQNRPTSAHEDVYMLTRRAAYYYDRWATLEPVSEATVQRLSQNVDSQHGSDRAHGGAKTNGAMKAVGSLQGANRRDVWTIPPEPYKGAHFATFPPRLVELCILSSTSEAGACPACGTPLQRVMKDAGPARAWQRMSGGDAAGSYSGRSAKDHTAAGVQDASAVKARILRGMRVRETTGWKPGCRCKTAAGPVACAVLDPFGGSGTTGLVAARLRRDAILIELSPKYAADARRRITTDAPLLDPVAPECELQLQMFSLATDAA